MVAEMSYIILVSVISYFLFGSALCLQTDTPIPIVRQLFDIYPEGTYNYAYETSNNIFAEEQGYLRDPETLVKQGQYQFTSPDGQLVRLVYTADENGFHPQGEHLPTPPPIPSSIQRSLKFQNVEESQ